MKKQYSRKQIEEAIEFWERELFLEALADKYILLENGSSTSNEVKKSVLKVATSPKSVQEFVQNNENKIDDAAKKMDDEDRNVFLKAWEYLKYAVSKGVSFIKDNIWLIAKLVFIITLGTVSVLAFRHAKKAIKQDLLKGAANDAIGGKESANAESTADEISNTYKKSIALANANAVTGPSAHERLNDVMQAKFESGNMVKNGIQAKADVATMLTKGAVLDKDNNLIALPDDVKQRLSSMSREDMKLLLDYCGKNSVPQNGHLHHSLNGGDSLGAVVMGTDKILSLAASKTAPTIAASALWDATSPNVSDVTTEFGDLFDKWTSGIPTTQNYIKDLNKWEQIQNYSEYPDWIRLRNALLDTKGTKLKNILANAKQWDSQGRWTNLVDLGDNHYCLTPDGEPPEGYFKGSFVPYWKEQGKDFAKGYSKASKRLDKSTGGRGWSGVGFGGGLR